ncbi:MAG TPA: hypothetical protein P5137_05280 [Candidatus Brocadiia bacterium]|nr:hypothetical protein [Candidatus Brocadiia bacterium]
MRMGHRFGLAVIAVLAFGCAASYGYSEASPFTTKLVAGQHYEAGVVKVWNDATTLYVTYDAGDGWFMSETHLHVATSLAEIPQTKKGNPIPGQFAYSRYYWPWVTENTFAIPLKTWTPGTKLYIAAHASMPYYNFSLWETAWAAGQDFPGANWATYFTYTVEQPCPPLTVPDTTIWFKNYAFRGRHNNTFDLVLWGVPSGFSIQDGVWVGWCAEETNAIDLKTWYEARAYSSVNLTGAPARVTSMQWDHVNYILNHKNPSAYYTDIQEAIWFFTEANPVMPSKAAGRAMVEDALANGAGFKPAAGQTVAVILVANAGVQIVFVEATMPSCSK